MTSIPADQITWLPMNDTPQISNLAQRHLADYQATPSPDPDTDPSPSDLVYDDMTAAWRKGDHALAWHLADVLLQYLANGGNPLTAPRARYYADAIHDYYQPTVIPDVRNER